MTFYHIHILKRSINSTRRIVLHIHTSYINGNAGQFGHASLIEKVGDSCKYDIDSFSNFIHGLQAYTSTV